MRIGFCTTCKNRTSYLKQTLPRNLAGNPEAVFVVLNYNTDDDLLDYLCDSHGDAIERGQLVVYCNYDEPKFRMGHAKNLAARCAIREGADILVTLDADNLAGPGFATYLAHKFSVIPGLSYLCPDVASLPPVGHRFNQHNPEWLGRGFMGRLAIRAQDFLKMGGYNEKFDVWQGEDIDLLARLRRLGLKEGFIDSAYLNAIAHGSEVRFSEWPEAQQHENDEIYQYTKNSTDTVVNYGVFGCGAVSRNFGNEKIDIRSVPTRVFGVGMQRTATYSLHRAFEILGLDSSHWPSAEWAASVWRETNRWGRSGTLERSYAACDNPIPMLYQKLDAAYPNSKFILTVRDEGKWLESMEKFWTYDHNPQRWTWDVDGFSHRMHGITYGQVTFDQDVFLGRYRRHNRDVLEHFKDRPDDLLVMDMSNGVTGWQKLCTFLDLPQPTVPYPHEVYGRNNGTTTAA